MPLIASGVAIFFFKDDSSLRCDFSALARDAELFFERRKNVCDRFDFHN